MPNNTINIDTIASLVKGILTFGMFRASLKNRINVIKPIAIPKPKTTPPKIKPLSSEKFFLKKALILSGSIKPLELLSMIAYIPNNVICIPIKRQAFAKMAVDKPSGRSNIIIVLKRRMTVKTSPKRKMTNPGKRKRYLGEKTSINLR